MANFLVDRVNIANRAYTQTNPNAPITMWYAYFSKKLGYVCVLLLLASAAFSIFAFFSGDSAGDGLLFLYDT